MCWGGALALLKHALSLIHEGTKGGGAYARVIKVKCGSNSDVILNQPRSADVSASIRLRGCARGTFTLAVFYAKFASEAKNVEKKTPPMQDERWLSEPDAETEACSHVIRNSIPIPLTHTRSDVM